MTAILFFTGLFIGFGAGACVGLLASKIGVDDGST